MNIEIFRQYLSLKDKKADLDAETKEVTDRLAFFENLILEEFVDNGIDSLRVDGRLVFPKRQLYASLPALTREVKAGLMAEGAADLITETVNGQRLSGFVREYMKEKGIDDITALPVWMKDGFNIYEKVSLGVRK
jgi:hypothetical protein